ncbi:hypothetical protein PHJA_000880700 [Phtheirospermum japonicum]|uniref:Uncharacterized protein n=1 Tax=Phtheirospermum japonicum TaxID=374723 RepID=A0A830BIE9_9LAMI|nr:hypothetical protein PHJA_000880700 [Phtheirospermum japonicum]
MAGRGKKRGRPRKDEPAEETYQDSISINDSKDEEELVPSPALPRYPTRYSSRANLSQSAIQNASSSFNSQAPAGSSRYPNPDAHTLPNPTKPNVDGPYQSGSINWSALISEHAKDLKPHNNVDAEDSINVTEFAKGFHDDMDEDPDEEEEVESSLEPGFVYVNKHKVKSEMAPLLTRIFDKYGDITIGTDLESPNSVSYYLQQLCHVCEQLEKTNFLELKRLELETIIADVRDFERAKMNVGWLIEKLDFISRTWFNFRRYYDLKQEVGKIDVTIGSMEKQLDVHKSQLLDIQQKIGDGEKELEAKKAQAQRIRNVVVDTNAGVKTLATQNLVVGLI